MVSYCPATRCYQVNDKDGFFFFNDDYCGSIARYVFKKACALTGTEVPYDELNFSFASVKDEAKKAGFEHHHEYLMMLHEKGLYDTEKLSISSLGSCFQEMSRRVVFDDSIFVPTAPVSIKVPAYSERKKVGRKSSSLELYEECCAKDNAIEWGNKVFKMLKEGGPDPSLDYFLAMIQEKVQSKHPVQVKHCEAL